MNLGVELCEHLLLVVCVHHGLVFQVDHERLRDEVHGTYSHSDSERDQDQES